MTRRDTSWDAADPWYDAIVGERGHHYHDSILLPRTLKLLEITSRAQGTLLDMGCGNGVLARHLPKTISYTGVDLSAKLLEAAGARSPSQRFICADATQPLPLPERNFDWACFLLSLQNMRHGHKAVQIAAERLKIGGKLLLVLNHPCFRIPRQSSWGLDEPTQLLQRRINRYTTPLEIPIQVHPGRGASSETTLTFHHPLSAYVQWLQDAGCVLLALEEWLSDKKSEGKAAKRENFARAEFPLFLTLLARKE